MTLLNFDEIDVTPTVTTSAPVVAPTITETVKVVPTLIAPSTDAFAPAATWTWEQLRDYVIRSIEARHGAFPRNYKTEGSIFKSFLSRHGSEAGAIAKYAFENCDGMWRNAPITVSRFTKNCDPYFAQPILDRLHQ